MSAEAGQFAENHFHILHNVSAATRVRHIDQMDQQARALDVPQELRPQARTGVRAFDQAGNVGDHKTDFVLGIAHRDHAEIGLQSSERIVGDLRPRRRDA